MPTDVNLDFSSAISGTLLDKDLEGTGFTSVQANTAGSAYDLSRIDLNTSASTLALTATQGDSAANALQNGLQVAINAATQPFMIATRLKGPFTTTLTTAEQQGGVFLGSSQDDYVKLVIVNSSNDPSGLGLEFFQEQNGAGANVGGGSGSQITGLDWVNINMLDLFLTGDPTAGTIKASYRVNSDTATPISLSQQFTPTIAASFFADEAIARAGILASTGNIPDTPDTTVTFDSFNINAAGSTPFAWKTVAPSPIERSEGPPSAVVNDKLYVFGGFYNNLFQATTRSDVYDPATNQWTRIADMPIPVTHLNAAVDGQTIWFAGGFKGDHPGPAISDVWKYDVASDTWSKGPSLPKVRGAGALVRLDRELHYFGGFAADRETPVGDHWVLSLQGGTNWTTAAPLPERRGHLGGAALDGKIYAIGGARSHHINPVDVNSVHAYDPTSDTWKAVASLPIPRSHFESSTTIFNDRLLIIGGRSKPTGKTALNHVTEYDPTTNTWLALPSLPVELIAPVAQVIGNQIIVTNGGLNRTTSPESTTRIGVLANKWESVKPQMPVALGEVAGGIIGNKLYLVGKGNSATLAHNLSTGTWNSTSSLAKRPFVGHHHGAEVVNGKLYLIGGLGSGAGKVQIYNPTTNTWNLGRDMPFAAGSSSTVVIGGEIYVAGGIVGSSTTAKVAKYNPVTNTWTLLAAMTQGRNHAAAATDGSKLYIFGGRGSGSGDANTVANGFDTVQIYNPATNTWSSSLDTDSTLAPLPQARGGMGKAVYFNGEFYVMGGETETGTGATINNVYSRVDIYNPQTNTWRFGTPMPTARHGIFPLLLAGRIHIAGGGIRAGNSSSSLLEIYNASPKNLPSPLAIRIDEGTIQAVDNLAQSKYTLLGSSSGYPSYNF